MTADAVSHMPAPPESAPEHGRAGRDLRAATIVGIGLAVLVLGTILLWRPAFVALVGIAAIAGVWELSHALAARGYAVPLVPVMLGTALMVPAGYLGGPETLVVAFSLTVIAVAVWRFGDRTPGYVRDTSAGIFVATYVSFLAGFAAVLIRPDDGPWRVLTVLAVVVASDTGGYLAGVLFGKHPMAPTVSPKKSWEGFAGSAVLGTGIGVLAVVVLLDGSWWAGLALGVAGVIAATLGDLGESLIKRDLGIKDMSSLLPGHGGIMDRVDSVLTTLPVGWLVLTALVSVS